MAIGALVVPGLFNDHITTGLASPNSELRISLVERWNSNAAWASETDIEYAIWAQDVLGSIGDPPLQGNAEITDASGELVVNTAGFFSVGDTVLVAIRKESAGPSSETVFALGEETITAV